MKLSITRNKNYYVVLIYVLNHEIWDLFKCEFQDCKNWQGCLRGIFYLPVYESIKEKLFKNNMLILYLLNKRSQFIVVK
jgi:hypothetical protein